jgi:DNA-binding transcriptional LysR family regulator
MVAESETFDGSLRDTRAFCAVVDFGSISGAARRLAESKGSISRRVTRLEDRLGVRLLARTSRAVTATEEGMAFHARAQAGLALLDEAADSARGQREVPRGNLRITCSLDLGTELLPPLIARFLTVYPLITPELIVTDTAIDLAAHRIDLALRMGTRGAPDQAQAAFELATSEIRLYAAPVWITANGMPAQPQDMTDRPILTLTRQLPDTGLTLIDGSGAKAAIQARVAGRSSDFASLIRLAEAGIGAAYLPSIMVTRALNTGTLVPLLPDWFFPGITLQALTLPGRDVPARVRLFRQFLKAELACD